MQCPRCQHENEVGANFCEECAAPLARTCANCGRQLSSTAKFCPACAHPAPTAPAPSTAQRFASPDNYTPRHLAEKILTSKSALEGERKQVTVLFADLKGSMELLADRDPEEARKILDPVLELMMEAVHRYEGTVNQVMGDGIMALFGAPLAHEDHALRACQAALRMQETVKRYAAERERLGQPPVAIRVGLNSGEVVVRSIGSDLRMEYSAVGRTTHLAARMEQFAAPGTTVVTDATLDLVEGLVDVRPLGPTHVKGLDEPVEVFELKSHGASRTRLQAAATRGFTRFIGRAAELDLLRRALERGRRGQGQVVAIVGEPGLGKSRLLHEFLASDATAGWQRLEARAVSHGRAAAYQPAIDWLRADLAIHEADNTVTIREKVTATLHGLGSDSNLSLSPLLSLLEVPVDDPAWQALDPTLRRRRFLDTIKDLALRESQHRPLMLVLEDLHWIDSETQALLDLLVDSLPGARILLLVNYRPEYQHGWGQKTYYTQLRIDPLVDAEVDLFLDALLGADSGLVRLRTVLLERSEGNPFFLEESVRTLVETGALAGTRGTYQLSQSLPTIEIPATVQALLAARIDRLGPEERSLLQTASVIGKDVPFALLHAVADLSEEALHQRLVLLQSAEFLYQTASSPEVEYTFKHALTHEVAYGSLLHERRRALHARIVEAMETLFGDRVTEHVERLAHHALRGEVWDKALSYLRQAGDKAIRRSAHAEAISHLTTALDLLNMLPIGPARAQQELLVQVALGPAWITVKGYAAAEVGQTYTRASDLCRQLGEPPQLVPTLVGLWLFYLLGGEMLKAREIGEELMRLARRTQDPVNLLSAHYALGTTLPSLGEIVEASEHLDRGIALYDPRKHHTLALLYGEDPRVACFVFRTWCLWILGYPDQARQCMHEMVAVARELSHPLSLAYALWAAAVLHQLRQERDLALQQAEAAMALSRERGITFYLALATILRGWGLAFPEQPERGIAEMREGLTAFVATGARWMQPYFLMLLAESCGNAGDQQQGLRVLAEARSVQRETSECLWEAELYRVEGDLLLKSSLEHRESKAEECFGRAIDTARRQQARSWELRAAISLGRLWQAQGKRDAVRQLLSQVHGRFTEGFDTVDGRAAIAMLQALAHTS